MGETPSPEDLTGRVLGGRFKIEKPLKRGGMGQVYAARDDEGGGGAVAVKVVRQALLEDPQALARFKREARLATELKHDNIVRSLATGEDGGLLWIAMELVEGESLRERLDARGRMSWQETLVVVEQVVKALQVAHDKGVIHRDLKPENIMLDANARAKLLDFGVAKQAHVEGQSAGTSNMTGTGLIVGTPGYVAPEVVLEGRTDDARSDFYALGVTWFEMLTAQKPFTAKTAFALAMRHAHEAPPTPTSFVPYSPVPAPIERLVLRLMAKNPDDRPQNAVSLLDALRNLADESQRALTNPTPAQAQSLDPHQATMTATDLSKPSTGVVPFKTPSSGLLAPLVALGSPGLATPATAQQQTPGAFAPGMTPQPDYSQLLPELGAQLKRAMTPKRVVAGSIAALAIGACVVVGAISIASSAKEHAVDAAATIRSTIDEPDTRTAPELPRPGEVSKLTPVAAVREAVVDAGVAVESAPKVAPPTPAPPAPPTPAPPAPPTPTPAAPPIPAPPMPPRSKTAKVLSATGTPSSTTTTAPAEAQAQQAQAATITMQTEPATTVLIDGDSGHNTPFSNVPLKSGRHHFTFVDPRTHQAIAQEDVEIKPGENKLKRAFKTGGGAPAATTTQP